MINRQRAAWKTWSRLPMSTMVRARAKSQLCSVETGSPAWRKMRVKSSVFSKKWLDTVDNLKPSRRSKGHSVVIRLWRRAAVVAVLLTRRCLCDEFTDYRSAHFVHVVLIFEDDSKGCIDHGRVE